MELFLWLWLFDERWVFNIKLSNLKYRILWFFPLFSQIFLILLCFYFVFLTNITHCEKQIKVVLFSKAFFSLLLTISIIKFYFNLKRHCFKEEANLELVHKVYPTLRKSVTNNHLDSYFSRKCLFNTNGIILLLLSITSFIWSYYGAYLNREESESVVTPYCNRGFEDLISKHSSFIFITNLPIIIVLIITIFIKIFSAVGTLLCPNLKIKIGKLRSVNVKKISC